MKICKITPVSVFMLSDRSGGEVGWRSESTAGLTINWLDHLENGFRDEESALLPVELIRHSNT